MILKDTASIRTEQDVRLLNALGQARELSWLGSERGLAEELGLSPSIFYKVRNRLQSFPKEGLFALEGLLGLNPDHVREGSEPRFSFPIRLQSEKRSVFERLRMAALVAGRSAENIQEAMGLTAARWKLLRQGSEAQIAGLAQALGRAFPALSTAWLLMGVGTPQAASSLAPTIRPLPDTLQAQTPSILHLPFVDLPARASFVAGYLSGSKADHLPLRPFLTQSGKRTPPDAVLIEVEGDSMAPTLLPKDVLLIAPVPRSEWKYESGGIYVVLYGEDHLVVKRIQRNGLSMEGRLMLSSDNPTGGQIELDGRDLAGIFKVLSVTRSL